jgi:hypothetical protein
MFMPTFSSQITLKVFYTLVLGLTIFDCMKMLVLTTLGSNVQQTDKYICFLSYLNVYFDGLCKCI